jgi:hypothetical protein
MLAVPTHSCLSGGAQVLVDESDAEEASHLLAEPVDEADPGFCQSSRATLRPI